MFSRRHFLQSGLALAALPLAARAASDDALRSATGPDWAAWTSPTPPLILPDLSGREHKLSAWRGSVVMLSFWATWCDPCRDEIPLMSAIARRHREGLRLVAVNVGESLAKVSTFLAKWPVAGTVLHDRNSAAAKAWNAVGLPANLPDRPRRRGAPMASGRTGLEGRPRQRRGRACRACARAASGARGMAEGSRSRTYLGTSDAPNRV